MNSSTASSLISAAMPLYDWQTQFILDRSRLKGLVKSRQIGGSTVCTLDAVLDMIATGQDWNTMSRTGRQAKKLLERAAKHVRAIDLYVRQTLKQSSIVSKITTEEIALKNGATMNALPCDPDTTVGDTVNWLLDENGLYPRSHEIFATLKPSTMHGKRMLVVSSARGRQNKFYELYKTWAEQGAASGWSFHRVTLEEAMRQNLKLYDNQNNPITFEQYREQEIRDIGHEMWLQEYMCEFLDAVSAFLSIEAIEAAQDQTYTLATPQRVAEMGRAGRQLFGGLDIGRKHDISVLWIVEKLGDEFRTVAVVPMHRTAFSTQREIVSDYLRGGGLQALNIDATGIGMQLAEELETEFTGVARGVSFTSGFKEKIANRLRIALEARGFTLPAEDEIVEDFNAIERIVLPTTTRIEANRSGIRTHGDFFWSAALAIEAAYDGGVHEVVIASAPLSRRHSAA